jgi:hypothetical protein
VRRIKHARLRFYSVKAGAADFVLPEVVESNDLLALLAVARAAEALDRNPVDSALEDALWRALDKLNKERK